MYKECEKISKFSGEIEIDESYFGAKRVRGKRGRGAANKTPVFGMLKRDGKVYTQIVKNCFASELIPILSQYSELDSSTIYSDCWKAYDGLVDYEALAHYRVKHSKNEFANGKNHINGIRISGAMLNIDYLNLKALRKRISYFILKSVNLDIILKLHRKTYIRNC